MTAEARSDWIRALIGRPLRLPALFEQALTHGSASADHYERLEFLGDRVLGLVIGEWLFDLYPHEPEGKLSSRLNMLVSGESCADIARDLGIGAQMILGKQARDDGANDSTNVLGDMMEALIGALFLDGGLEDARTLIRRLWATKVEGAAHAPKHPKSELQEWAAANRRKSPVYVLTDRSGPHHNLRFTVTVSIPNVGEASATGASKQEAETAAARTLLEQIA
ncbi:ribonuclease III [Sphingobium subterraneum]|uniref:Ribonuclease 3 n=1 Tax=Sphingobium subterraneum TaxID=627688 RepID=A0A841J177_9SPHN|nr:ribonuclease III [Sphingobium subterraneum]MBB6123276.1 ribonuclease-3 [Sphingobium subterraneum]